MNGLVLIQFFSCCFMSGVIWLVQVLMYPNFNLIGQSEFKKFHQFHTQRITWIVAPVMGLELLSGAWLFAINQNSFYFFNLLSIISLWGLTAFVNVPLHQQLENENQSVKMQMAHSNWPRTVIWTLRSIVWIVFLFDSRLF